MIFSGIQKVSFSDYSGKLSMVLFTKGCNFNCPYCHNGHLVNGKDLVEYQEEDVLDLIRQRAHLVNAIVISGGEPTLHGDNLINFMSKLKALGMLVKLDTNGTNPEFLDRVIQSQVVDYVAMDIKGPKGMYSEIVKTEVSIEDIEKSIQLILNSNILYEFRTTVVGGIHSKYDISQMLYECRSVGKHYLQNFKDTESVLGGKGVFTSVDFLADLNLKDNTGVQIR